MKTFFLSFPRLNISLTAPDEIIPDIQAAFFHSIRHETNLSPRHKYVIESIPGGFGLLKDGQQDQQFTSCLDLICQLEEDVENTLIRSIGGLGGVSCGSCDDRRRCLRHPGKSGHRKNHHHLQPG